MRKVVVNSKNFGSFGNLSHTSAEVLAAVDELLHDKGLELVLGDNGSADSYMFKIEPVKEDGEYDKEKTISILFGGVDEEEDKNP